MPAAKAPPPGTEGYAAEAETLLHAYEQVIFAEVHAAILDLIPPAPADILELGAGTGRDAAYLAALGHRVTAVEPTDALRQGARRLHPDPAIRWSDDSLPALASLTGAYDLILLTAVWMHLDASERAQAMPRLASLLRPGAALILSLRHGPVPPGRRMFAVGADETASLAATAGLTEIRRLTQSPVLPRNIAEGITWTRLAFRKPA